MSIEKLISPLVESQFPGFYHEDGQNFITFTKAYFEWLEQPNNAIAQARSLPTYRDIDTTLEDFITHFKEKYLKNIEFDTKTNKRLLVKNSLDLYRSKGSDRSIDLLFKLVYGTNAKIYRPGDDIFKLSDGEWVKPQYIEITVSPRTVSLVGKQITGVNSGATAFVERYVKRKVKDGFVYMLYVTNIAGTFVKDEIIGAGSVYPDLPKIVGSMTALELLDPGYNFNVGDIVIVSSSTGDYGQARVTEVKSQTGVVDFLFVDGGYGYTTTPDVIVSNNVIKVGNVQQNSGEIFALFETVTQPLSNVAFTSANGGFVEGATVNTVSGSGNGIIISLSQTVGSTTGSMLISRLSGSFTTGGDVIKLANNAVGATIGTGTNVDASGKVVKQPNKISFELPSTTGFKQQLQVYQTDSFGEFANGTIQAVNDKTITVTNLQGTFLTNSPLKVRDSSIQANITSMIMELALYDVTGTFTASYTPLIEGVDSGPIANALTVAGGKGASFNILNISDTEIIYLNSDLLSGSNSTALPYINMALNANTYGFPANTAANVSSYIFSSLAFSNLTIGSITGITNINPGSGYGAAPGVLVSEPLVAAWNKQDYLIRLANTSLSYAPGEFATQNNTLTFTDITVASNTGWKLNEFVYQGTYPSTTANGNIVSVTGNVLRLSNVAGTWASSANAISLIWGTTSLVSAANANVQISVQAKGIVVSANTSYVHLTRRQMWDAFQVGGGKLTGTDTLATADIIDIATFANSIPIGLNADVEANSISSNGTPVILKVDDSGLQYHSGQQATFQVVGSNDVTSEGVAKVITSAIGTSKGYFKSSKGFISDTKYIFDSDYYQEYSYEIISRLPFDRYSEMLKKVLHTAGTKAFGSVVIESEAPVVQANTVIQMGQGYFISGASGAYQISSANTTLTKA